ncbi:alpha/beta fold hydrolase [Deinococcus cellulosilyticus]|uniref:Alpha/beta hydrolase n=1 Tax=Deinococcus cellulosilyticus (strain DSM 18568 / NBRC 106333 / KACC 11606 / 5516J-15) TaxID=1223518 RepID=A0A511MX81_DEIC1|nr:alpha/beta hydrolase [Deinococcus cellulosilyticus]GEM44971.1 alpha/beta hydrolase [Deinococcus cellulosilyticus NBRC 106333 = KACC 11606]
MHQQYSRFIEVSDRKIHLLEAGQGPPLVLLHGTAIDSAWLSYGRHLDHFARHFHVFAPDFPGYGLSSDPQKRHQTRELAEFLLEFLDALNLQKSRVVAFSMGGAIALQVALRHPERFERLVLVDSFGLFGRIHVPWIPRLGIRAEKFALWLWDLSRKHPGFLALILKLLVIHNPRLVTRELLSELQSEMNNPETFLRWLQSELGWTRYTTNMYEDLPNLQVPTLLVHAQHDRVTPASRTHFAVKKIKNAKHIIIPRSGHWVMREQPETWRSSVLDFLLSDLVDATTLQVTSSSAGGF